RRRLPGGGRDAPRRRKGSRAEGAVRPGGRDGQGQPLQHRSTRGVGAPEPARPGRGDGGERVEPPGEPRRALARGLPLPRRRAVAQAYACLLRPRRIRPHRVQAGEDHAVPAEGKSLLMSKVTLRIQRFDPERDAAPAYREYTVEVEPTDRVLDALNSVKWYQDGSLTYRRSCAHGVCGSDAMR